MVWRPGRDQRLLAKLDRLLRSIFKSDRDKVSAALCLLGLNNHADGKPPIADEHLPARLDLAGGIGFLLL
jgi:hypothetical protein